GRRRPRRGRGGARGVAARRRRPPDAPPAPGGRRAPRRARALCARRRGARALRARSRARRLGALDARRLRRLPGDGRVREALGDATRGGIAAPVKVPESYRSLRAGRVRAVVREDLVTTLGAWL